MNKVVLDTSVIVKSILAPRKSLPKDVYEREIETHKKCRKLIKLLDSRDFEVYIPNVALVEVASVLKRNGYHRLIPRVLESLSASYIFIPEEDIFELSIEVATKTGASGFDCYFIATALLLNATLITDDKKMNRHARSIGLNSILIREKELEEIKKKLGE